MLTPSQIIANRWNVQLSNQFIPPHSSPLSFPRISLIKLDFSFVLIPQECSNNSIYYQATYSFASNGANNLSQEEYKQSPQQQQQPGTTRLTYRLALPRPTTCPAEIYDLMLECWQLNEHIRPSFRDITQFLSARNNPATVEQIYA